MNLIFEEDAYFDCHSSGTCCRTNWSIPVEPSKVDRLRQLGPPLAIVQESGGRSKLGRESGACAFLSSDDLCRVHKELSSGSKPNACQLFPFVVYPTPDGLHIGVSHFCPSVRGRKGRPIKTHESSLRIVLEQMEFKCTAEPAILGEREPLGWTAYRFLEAALLERIAPDPLEALLGLHQGLKMRSSWWNCDLSDLFLAPDPTMLTVAETAATSLTGFLQLELAEGSQANGDSIPYVKSLIRRKYLHRREFFDGLQALAVVHIVVSRARDRDGAVEVLESHLTHTREGLLPSLN